MFRHIAAIGLSLVLLNCRSAAGEPVVVVELFTSQGCSSCPPADAFLSELAKMPDLLALSEHVDYWDYLGWKDPFALAENTRRQRQYAKRLGLGYVYTPQIVVHGLKQASGSDRPNVLKRIYESHATAPVRLEVEEVETGAWVANLAATPLTEAADVWLVRFEPVHFTPIARGENRGRKIENTNVVREFHRLGVWSGEPVSLAVPEVDPTSGEARAILVQEPNGGRILAAARLQRSTEARLRADSD